MRARQSGLATPERPALRLPGSCWATCCHEHQGARLRRPALARGGSAVANRLGGELKSQGTRGQAGSVDRIGAHTERLTRSLALLSIVALIVLRLVELRTLEHLLYSPELLELGSLAWHVDHGGLRHDGTITGFIATYQYNHFDQGTLAVQVVHWMLSRLPVFEGVGIHLVGIACEALSFGAFIWLATRIAGPRGLLAALPLLLPPAFIVAWQLMPYGNHTDFLIVPIALGLIWLRWNELPRWGLMAAILAGGVLLYRLNAACLPACLVAALLLPQDRIRPVAATVAASGLALATITALFFVWPEAQLEDVGAIPRLQTVREPEWARLSFLGAPRTILSGWPWRVGLVAWGVAGIWGGLTTERLRPFTIFVFVLAASALIGPLLFAPTRPEYLLTGIYALLLAGLPGPIAAHKPVRLLAGVGAVLMTVSGLIDAQELADPDSWPTTEGFDGARLHFELGVESPDADEIPHYLQVLEQGQVGRHFGLATATHEDPQCPLQPARLDPGPLERANADRCPGWSEGLLGARVNTLVSANWNPTTQQLRDFGAGAWVTCQRQVTCVESALKGAPPNLAATILVGARAQAAKAR